MTTVLKEFYSVADLITGQILPIQLRCQQNTKIRVSAVYVNSNISQSLHTRTLVINLTELSKRKTVGGGGEDHISE
jgi:hypothetical protein